MSEVMVEVWPDSVVGIIVKITDCVDSGGLAALLVGMIDGLETVPEAAVGVVAGGEGFGVGVTGILVLVGVVGGAEVSGACEETGGGPLLALVVDSVEELAAPDEPVVVAMAEPLVILVAIANCLAKTRFEGCGVPQPRTLPTRVLATRRLEEGGRSVGCARRGVTISATRKERSLRRSDRVREILVLGTISGRQQKEDCNRMRPSLRARRGRR